jgi:hypothetical protein
MHLCACKSVLHLSGSLSYDIAKSGPALLHRLVYVVTEGATWAFKSEFRAGVAVTDNQTQRAGGSGQFFFASWLEATRQALDDGCPSLVCAVIVVHVAFVVHVAVVHVAFVTFVAPGTAYILLRIVIKGLFAAWRTKVIGLPFVFCSPLGSRFVDLHVAN